MSKPGAGIHVSGGGGISQTDLDNAGYLVAASNLGDVASAATSLANLLPAQAGNTGNVLQTDGSAASWQTASGGSPDSESAVVAAQMFS